MDSYISSELIAKLRQDQRHLRQRIDAFEHSAAAEDFAQLKSQLHEFSTFYQSHERLVGALLEAVEPDDTGAIQRP